MKSETELNVMTRHLYACGARPVLEALRQVERGESVLEVLRAFYCVSVRTFHDVGASELPIDPRELH